MAHSLEVRVPLIDHELVEFMIRLPGNFKMSHQPSAKPLLVNALNGALPNEVIHRKKSTFTFPWEYWLRGELRERVEQTLRCLPEPLHGIINPNAVEKVWQSFLSGGTSWSRPWALYVLFKWVEKNLVSDMSCWEIQLLGYWIS